MIRENKPQALAVLLITVVVFYFIGNLFFDYVIDVFVVPFVGFRPVLAAGTMAFFIPLGYKIVDLKYNFQAKGGSLFKDVKLFRR